MECVLKVRLLFPILLLITTCVQQNWDVAAEPQVPCYFIFGDSLPDAGNNNVLLPGGLKSNYLPYGIDFPTGPTGRFSNNRTTADIIGQLLGFEYYIPALARLNSSYNILQGVNYASGGSGIRDDTGLLGTRISLNMQLQNHQTVVRRIRGVLGSAAANDLLSKCIYTITTASNDYVANYYLPLSGTRLIYTPDRYATVLVTQFSQQLQRLYNEGARKIAVYGLAQLGCTPFVINSMNRNGTGTCVQNVNDAAAMFNTKLRSLVDELNPSLPGANFTYLNAYTELASLLGPVVPATTCCETTPASPSCVPNGRACSLSQRNSVVFYDALHPTDAANVVFAGISYKARSPADAHPYDISQLASGA